VQELPLLLPPYLLMAALIQVTMQVNGINAGTNSSTFTSTTLNNGDVVTVIMTSNAACALPTIVTSNAITMVVTAIVVPSVSIAAIPSEHCAGTSVTFTATPTNSALLQVTSGNEWSECRNKFFHIHIHHFE